MSASLPAFYLYYMRKMESPRVWITKEKWLGECHKCNRSVYMSQKHENRTLGGVTSYWHIECPTAPQ